MHSKVVIFDFDGTIADTFTALIQISNQLAKIFKFKEINPAEIEDLKHQNVHFVIQHLKISRWRLPGIIAHAQKEIGKQIHLIKPIDGLAEILQYLHEHDYKLGILTTNSLDNVHKFLDHHNLNYFDFIQSCPRLLGKHRVLAKILKKYKLDKNHVWYVGDEIRDIEAARRIGIPIVAVGWGYNSPQALGLLEPDHLIKTPQELRSIFL
ncbi:MAG: HAD-IA family hydrolase [Candidatus Omnitrophica bacterium]|nr:HAD-IA family hydrolase [Candidatus Omnitrophota bacterium]